MVGMLFSLVFMMVSLTVQLAVFTLRLMFLVLGLGIEAAMALAHSRR